MGLDDLKPTDGTVGMAVRTAVLNDLRQLADTLLSGVQGKFRMP